MDTVNQTEQLSLFGDEYAPQEIVKKNRNHQARAAAPSNKTVNTQARSTKDQNIELDLDFTVHYATHTFLITDFVQDIPESGKIGLKQLRELMEQQFFELTEQRTVWDYDLEKKQLMPYASGTTKGHVVQ